MTSTAILTVCFLLLVTASSPGAVAQEVVYLSQTPELLIGSRQDWGELGWGVAAHASGLQGQALRIGDKPYEHGLGHHANGIIQVLLSGEFSVFEAEVGIQPCAGGTVVFRIIVDGQERYDSGIMRSGETAKAVRVDVQGAQEMVLEAHDASDGISCDMAVWAEARLTRTDARAPAPANSSGPDMGRFARVVTCDPERNDGSRANRIEEFRADDVFTETELKPRRDGFYEVPAVNGKSCIGLQWLNRRALREVRLEFAGTEPLPVSSDARVEGWFGESAWQGTWKALAGEWHSEQRQLVFRLHPRAGVVQTQKVRWILPLSGRAIPKVRLTALTRSTWAGTNIFAQVEQPAPGSHGIVSIRNGEWLGRPVKDPAGQNWADLSRPIHLSMRYSRPGLLNSDPTVLTFSVPAGQVSVAVSDVLSNDCVYLPDYGLFVAREPLPVTMAQYKRRIADRRTILQEVRELPDQSLEQSMARTHHDYQHEGPVMLSLACDNTKFVVERDGVVRFHPEPFQWLGTHQQVDWSPWYANGCEVRPQLGRGGTVARTRHLDGGWLPVPVIATEEGGISYQQTTLVAPLDRGSAGPTQRLPKSICAIEFVVSNTLPQSATGSVLITFVANSKRSDPATVVSSSGRLLAYKDGNPIAIADLSEAAEASASQGVLKWSPTLGVGEQRRVLVYLPGEGVTAADLPDMQITHDLRGAVKRYWSDILGGSTSLQTPDELLNNLIRSSQVRCLIGARSEAGGERVGASIAAMSYGPLESEAHSVIRGMDFMGHADFARRSLDFFIHRYTTNGFLTTGYTTFGTAWHLWAIGEHYQLTRDTNWLRQAAPEIARVCHWVLRQTAKTKKLDAFGQPVPELGLMPPGVLADWNTFAYHFAMNAYYAKGLQVTADALKEIGHPDAREFAAGAPELRRQTLRAYAWTQARSPALALRDGTWIPHYPSQVHSPGRLAEFFPGQDAGRSWCYDVEIGAHQLVPTGVLEPRGREAQRIMDHMEDVQFLSDGWFDYPAPTNHADWFNLGGFSKVQPYYTRNCEVYALRDDVKPFIRSHFNSIASLVNPEVLTFWEHFRHSGAWDKTHETGYFLHQSRTMLVQERGDDLWLAPFIPSDWLKDGRSVRVNNAGTRFGRISYSIASHLAEGHIDLNINGTELRGAGRILLRLRAPDGRSIKAVIVDGKPHKGFDARKSEITLPVRAQAVQVMIQ